MLLTSAGFLNPAIGDFVRTNVKKLGLTKVAIITTAAEGKEHNKYSQLAFEQLRDVGFKQIDFFDLETQGFAHLPEYQTFYVCGGNTFKLLKYANDSRFKHEVQALLGRGGMYIGVSAGSIIVGPSVQLANEVEPDPNEIGLTDFTGLHLTDVTIFPHYENRHETELRDFERKHNIQITRITNDQAVSVADGAVRIIQ